MDKTFEGLDKALMAFEGRHIHDSGEVLEYYHSLGLVERMVLEELGKVVPLGGHIAVAGLEVDLDKLNHYVEVDLDRLEYYTEVD